MKWFVFIALLIFSALAVRRDVKHQETVHGLSSPGLVQEAAQDNRLQLLTNENSKVLYTTWRNKIGE